MNRIRFAIIVTAVLLVAAVMAASVLGQGERNDQKATGAIQYKVVSVPNVMTQAQMQTLMTTQGNAGFRFVAPLAVGTGPIPNQTVFVFSKP